MQGGPPSLPLVHERREAVSTEVLRWGKGRKKMELRGRQQQPSGGTLEREGDRTAMRYVPRHNSAVVLVPVDSPGASLRGWEPVGSWSCWSCYAELGTLVPDMVRRQKRARRCRLQPLWGFLWER